MTDNTLKRKLIIDTDSGGDDAVAMMLAFSHPTVEVHAISTCWGNVSVHQATENVGKLLDFYGLDIPLYKGAEGPLLGVRETVAWEGYGKDGYGDAGFPVPIHQPTSATPACLALMKHLQDIRPFEESGEVVQLVVLGPCTNLALALKLDKTLCDNLGGGGYPGLILMGGAYEAKGNSNMAAEFNFHCDPEAAHIVLNSVKIPVHLVAWELTVTCSVSWQWFDRWLGRGKHQNRVQVFYEKLFKKLEDFTRPSDDGARPDTGDDPITQDETCVMPDAVAMVVALEPDIIEESFETFCTVELWGRETRGMTVFDWYGTEASMKKAERSKNCVLVTQVNNNIFLSSMASIIDHPYVNEPATPGDDVHALFEPGRRRSRVCSEFVPSGA
ncbi:Uridine nucleosidase 1 [Diplonema papillatum]|nr:Uridine nucleosidase 1 [Diplonema papillatum]